MPVLEDCCEICNRPYVMTADEIRECIKNKIRYKGRCPECRDKEKEKS